MKGRGGQNPQEVRSEIVPESSENTVNFIKLYESQNAPLLIICVPPNVKGLVTECQQLKSFLPRGLYQSHPRDARSTRGTSFERYHPVLVLWESKMDSRIAFITNAIV
ncbi:hypothetical protein CEXT_211511 [Caerostris extrusa]|uniref:Uncharacterized protein n=1 Tax=Caerostris extrusa TaxID=172846 RepID=A0AAV4QAF0_CAEEX|nr:hypothetical protein CEXT_211511 [Caerostris extrusa]